MPQPTSSKSKSKKKTASSSRKPAAVRKPKVTVSTKKKAPAVSKKIAPVVSKPVRRNFHIGIQMAIAGSAVAVLLLLAAVERNVFATRGGDAAAVPVTIGLEHESPLSLSVLFAKKESAGYVSIRNASNENIHVSVPSSWIRSEVTGTDIANVTQDIPVFGFTRYALPAGAGMKMLLSEAPESVFFDSTSDAVTAVDLKSIDLVTSKVGSKVVLVQKQSLIPLWNDAE